MDFRAAAEAQHAGHGAVAEDNDGLAVKATASAQSTGIRGRHRLSLNEEVELLRNIQMFSKIEPSKLKLLAFTSERLTFQNDQVVCRQGEIGDAMYIIVDGTVDVMVDTPDGNLTVAQFGKNDFFGEIAILCDVPRTATIKATSELTTLKIAKDLFYRLATEFPQMAVEVARDLAQRLQQTTNDLQATKNELSQVKSQISGTAPN